MRRTTRSAFTLIELLVVITIIVVLLALLVPAMDKALYTAELAVCAANQRGVVTGVVAYTFDNKRRYPHRQALKRVEATGAKYRRPDLMKSNLFGDDYTPLKKYTEAKMLIDPLTGGITSDAWDNSSLATNLYANYSLWWDWKFENDGGGGLQRYGQTFSWGQARFDVLISEMDAVFPGNDRTHNSHPDSDGVQALEVKIDGDSDDGLETLARWRGFGTSLRGTFDANYGYQDGSVSSINQVTRLDNRLEQVPDKVDGREAATRYIQIPAQGARSGN